jgi:short-subunit dehydrogenase
MKIQDSVIIVTGASAGIGLAVAKALAHNGAKVVLAARSQEKLKELEAEIPGSFAVVMDMRKHSDIKRLIEKTEEKFGRIDALINNAGQGMMADIESIDIKEYREIMDLNVFSVLEAMQLVIPIMRKQGAGTILNVSSMVSKNYYPRLAAYASTKYALNALTLTAREELKDAGIIVSIFHPKMTATDFGKNAYVSNRDATSRPPGGMTIDTAEQVAEEMVKQLESGEAEANM